MFTISDRTRGVKIYGLSLWVKEKVMWQLTMPYRRVAPCKCAIVWMCIFTFVAVIYTYISHIYFILYDIVLSYKYVFYGNKGIHISTPVNELYLSESIPLNVNRQLTYIAIVNQVIYFVYHSSFFCTFSRKIKWNKIEH